MRQLAIILTLLLVSSSLSFGQGSPASTPPDSARAAAATQFRQQHGNGWQIAWHEKAATPATLTGGIAQGYTGPPEEVGRAFLQEHQALFGIQDMQQDIAVARRNTSDGRSQVFYQQVYEDIPVLYSGYLVAVDDAGAVYYVSGDYYPDLNVPTTSPSLSLADVVSHMRSDLGSAPSFKVLQKPKLAVYVDDEDKANNEGRKSSYHLAYEARAERREPLEAYKYVIDARSGEVLQKISLVTDVHGGSTAAKENASLELRAASATSTVNGSGKVYETNPLHGSPVSVTLHRLWDVSPRLLEGENILVTNEEAAEASSFTGTFNYSSSNTHFDEVMTYYHSDEFEAWLIGDLGMSSNQLTCQVEAETHSSDFYARTFPSSCEVFLADGSAFLGNPTHEAAIITHEYMHDVSETYNDLTQSFDASALDEGYSDFFAVANRHANTSVTSTRLGAFVGLPPERTVDNTYQFSDYENSFDLTNNGSFSAHDGGVVLAGALWDFHTEVASSVEEAAEITLGSLQYLGGDPSFMDARGALVTAAGDAGHPTYSCGIKDVFNAHGIGGPGYRVAIDGPGAVNPDVPRSWQTSTFCGTPSYSYRWFKGSSPSSLSLTSKTSSSYSQPNFYGEDEFYLKVEVTDQGNQIVTSDLFYVDVNEHGCGTQIDCENNDAAAAELLPGEFALDGGAPNPFREQTTIRYALPEPADVTLTVYDVMGREVARPVERQMPAGFHDATLQAEGLASGVYFYRIEAGSFAATEKVVLVK